MTGTLPDTIGPVGVALQPPAQVWRAFPATLDSPREARRFVARALREVDSPELSEITTLVVSELAANAVGHARSVYRVSLSVESGRIRLGVSDDSREEPMPRGAEKAATTGRGLRLVDSLVDRRGVRRSGEGKEIWAEIATGD